MKIFAAYLKIAIFVAHLEATIFVDRKITIFVDHLKI